jgi:hypothetical protein
VRRAEEPAAVAERIDRAEVAGRVHDDVDAVRGGLAD